MKPRSSTAMKIESGDIPTSLNILDPDGFRVQFSGLRQ
jgi:hypothetical protein